MAVQGTFRKIGQRFASPWLAFAVAVIIRIAVLIHTMHNVSYQWLWGKNETGHLARSLLAGHGYRGAFDGTTQLTAWIAPGYPLLVTLVFSIFGLYTPLSTWIVIALNLLFSALTTLSVFALGKRYFGSGVGALAAWIWACWYYLAVVPLLIWDTSLSALLLSLELLFVLHLETSERWRDWILFGIFCGGACLINPSLTSVVPFFLIYLGYRWKTKNKAFASRLAVSTAALILTVTPWLFRNYVVLGKFAFIRSDLPAQLYYGNHPGLGNEKADMSNSPAGDPSEYNRLGEAAYMSEMRKLFLQYLRSHPGEFLRRSMVRFLTYWSAPPGSPWGIVSVLAFVGFGLAIFEYGSSVVPLGIPLIFFPIVYYFVFVWPKYRHPIEPAIIVLFAFAISRIACLLNQMLYYVGLQLQTHNDNSSGSQPTSSQ